MPPDQVHATSPQSSDAAGREAPHASHSLAGDTLPARQGIEAADRAHPPRRTSTAPTSGTPTEEALAPDEPTSIDAAVRFFERVFARDGSGWAKLDFRSPAEPDRHHIRSIPLHDPRRASRVRAYLDQFVASSDCYLAIAVYAADKAWNPGKKRRGGGRGWWDFRTAAMVRHGRWAIAERDAHPRGDGVPAPTLVVATSAGRFQDWYELDEPVSAETLKELNARLAHGSGFGHEAIDAARVLRLPGTRNRKPGRRGAVVRVVEASAAVFVPEDFLHLARYTGRTAISSSPDPAPRARPIAPGRGPAAVAPAPLAFDQRDGARLWAGMRPRLSGRMRAVADGEAAPSPTGEAYASASNADMALICALLRLGLGDDAVAAAFLASPRGRMLIDRKGASGIDRRMAGAIEKGRAYLALRPPDASFIAVDAALLGHTATLRPAGVAVAVLMMGFAPEIFPSRAHLAALLGVSPGQVGAQIRALAQDLGLFIPAPPRGRQPVYRMRPTAELLPLVPRSLARAGLGADGIAAYTAIAGRQALAGIHPAQDDVAALLGVPRRRIGAALLALEAAGYIAVARREARGLRRWRTVATPPDVRNTRTNRVTYRGDAAAPPPTPADGSPAQAEAGDVAPPCGDREGHAAAAAPRRTEALLRHPVAEGRAMHRGTIAAIGQAELEAAKRRARARR